MSTGRPWSSYYLVAGTSFWSVMALGGGYGLASAPDGAALHFDTAWLSGTPFRDYLGPGLILAGSGVAGVASSALVVRALRAARDGRSVPARDWYLVTGVAAVHTGWIAGELLLLWDVVAGLPAEQRRFFHGFWGAFTPLTALNLAAALAPATRRTLGRRGGRRRVSH